MGTVRRLNEVRSMRLVAFFVVAALGVPQAALGQEFEGARFPLPAPFVVDAATASTRTGLLSAPGVDDPVNPVTFAAPSKRTWIGAGVGFVVGGVATWAILNTGGSTAPCDRDANQDAMSAGECAAITVLGGAAGALVGVLVARLL